MLLLCLHQQQAFLSSSAPLAILVKSPLPTPAFLFLISDPDILSFLVLLAYLVGTAHMNPPVGC